MLWGLESDIMETSNGDVIYKEDLRRVFDFIITLEQPLLRHITL